MSLVICAVVVSTAVNESLTSTDNQAVASDRQSVSAMEPRLEIDLHRQRISVKLADVLLREYKILNAADTNEAEQFKGNESSPGSATKVARGVLLIAATETIPPAELIILSEESGLKPEKVQRYIPRKLVLVTGDGARIIIESDCQNAKSFLWPRLKNFFGQIWAGLLGRDTLHLVLSADDAMSLYGVAVREPEIIINP
ncbi:MAG: hypothetical protein ACOYVF_13275 [Candidatus Zixiibacteriota bacterium]